MLTEPSVEEARPNPTWAGRSQSRAVELFRTTLGPLLLVIVTPPAAVLFWIACTYLDGSLLRLASAEGLTAIAEHFPRPTLRAALVVLIFAVFEGVLLQVLPGKTHLGPVTPAGQRPRYKLNGIFAWIVTHAAFLGASYGLGWFSPGIVFEHFGEILITLCTSCFVFCWFLYFKGLYAPSTPDAGSNGNVIMDYFWGVELHPSIFGLNLKQLFNCRIGMMGWNVTILSFAAAQHRETGHLSTSMLVAVALQTIYILKFFYWEGGYFGSLDIMHDRFGYYICWGVISWIPAVYTITTQYLVRHPRELSPAVAIAIFVFGVAAIWANYDADAQRQRVRATDGKTTVWGKPPELIRAEYTTTDGKKHESLLLVSGWWGMARHFHYVTELSLALAWSLPAGFDHFLPYFYLTFLTILLLDRAGRDDLRCRTKYGRFWDRYCERVRWKVLPYVY
jgi:7-dehydrocholesterol reductase